MESPENKKTAYASNSNEGIQIMDILFNYLKYWKQFIISVILCVGISLLYLNYTPKKYHVSSNISIRDDKKGQLGIDISVFSDLGIPLQNANVDTEIEILQSKTLMQQVVDSLKIGVSYYAKENIRKQELYKELPIQITVHQFKKEGEFKITKEGLNNYFIESEKHNFKHLAVPGVIFNSPWGFLSLALTPSHYNKFPINVVIEGVDVLPKVNISMLNKNSTVLNLAITTTCKSKGIDIINTLVDIYNQQAIEEKNTVTLGTIKFINERLQIISGELESAEKDVEDYKKSKNITDLKAEASIFLSATNEYDRRISEIELQSEILSSIKTFLLDPKNRGNIIPVNLGISDPTITSVIELYNKEILERNKLTAGMRANNPILKEYSERMYALREDLLKGLQIADLNFQLTKKELTKQGNIYSSKIRGLSTQEREARELYRQKEIKETLFIYLLQKREETGLALAMALPNAKIIDSAYVNRVPVSPKPIMVLFVAILFGLMIPIVYIYLKGLLNYKLQNKEELLSFVKTPFLGEVSIGKMEIPFPVEKTNSAIAEKFRIIDSNLSFVLGTEKEKVVMVTSTFSGEGKSFFSRNLAFSHASLGKKTLLIDLDIRKSILHKTLNINPNKELVMYLSNSEVILDDVIIKDLYPNLDLIPTKIIPPNPAELLASNRLDELFEQLRGKYDMIVIDTAPIGLVADAFRINQFSNACIYVTRKNYTHKNSLNDIQDLYQNHKLHNISCVLNGVSLQKKDGYSNYYTED